MLADRGRQPHRQLDREHRGRLGYLHPARPRRGVRVPAGLPRRAPEPRGQHARGLRRRHASFCQLSGRVDPLGVLTPASTTTTRHAINILPEMSRMAGDTPGPPRRQQAPARGPRRPPGPRARHGSRSPDLPAWRVTISGMRECAGCGQRLPRPLPGAGRPMAYCSPACRQRAYRARGGRASGTTGAERRRRARQAPDTR